MNMHERKRGEIFSIYCLFANTIRALNKIMDFTEFCLGVIFRKYDILDEITEIRTRCGFRENMIHVANRPCDEVALEWPICLHLESLIQDVIHMIRRRKI